MLCKSSCSPAFALWGSQVIMQISPIILQDQVILCVPVVQLMPQRGSWRHFEPFSKDPLVNTTGKPPLSLLKLQNCEKKHACFCFKLVGVCFYLAVKVTNTKASQSIVNAHVCFISVHVGEEIALFILQLKLFVNILQRFPLESQTQFNKLKCVLNILP